MSLVNIFHFILKFIFFICFFLNIKYEFIFFNDKLIIYKNIIHNHPGFYNNKDKKFKNKSYIFFNSKKPWYIFCSFTYSLFLSYKINTIFQDTHFSITQHKNQILLNKIDEKSYRYNWKLIHETILYIKLNTFSYPINIINSLISEIAKLNWLKINTIYFDLSYNSGGSSIVGSTLLQAIFGYKKYNEFMQKYNQTHPNECLWRASKDNLTYLKSIKPENKIMDTWIDKIKNGIKDSLSKNKKYFKEIKQIENIQQLTLFDFNYNRNIVCIINNQCNSATLDFIAELMILKNNNILFIGEKTKTDTQYMEIREIPLTTNNLYLSIPIKMYPKKQKRYYEPHINIDFSID